ncbi:hypothetical protein K438DRAFT_1781111 [Mycena galopus ATCC 62051]|nr:hypothetical protein K438DRAFT_1781111 [Mycena galopus ATCC 62051]
MDRIRRAFHHLLGFPRKTQNSPAFTAQWSNEHKTQSPPRISRERNRTTANALKFTFATFNSISRGSPGAEAFGGIIEPLLEITKSIEQTAINAEGLAGLKERIQDLTPVATRLLREGCPQKAQLVVERLRKVLGWITQDLEVTHWQGKLSQFFNCTDNAATLERHHKALDRLVNNFMINDYGSRESRGGFYNFADATDGKCGRPDKFGKSGKVPGSASSLWSGYPPSQSIFLIAQ